ncbi:hypothetical protein JHK86_002338 [Glycine max]|nr:hypothetical protein JHK86_002338 [Glycine max]
MWARRALALSRVMMTGGLGLFLEPAGRPRGRRPTTSPCWGPSWGLASSSDSCCWLKSGLWRLWTKREAVPKSKPAIDTSKRKTRI